MTLRVLRGAPTPEELAAVLAVLTRPRLRPSPPARSEPSPAPLVPTQVPPTAWNHPGATAF